MQNTVNDTNAHATLHAETVAHDEARAVAATDAGSECGWEITGRPSSPRTFAELNARGVVLGRLANMRDEAEADPAAFVKAFFDAIDNGVSDLAFDAVNEYPHEHHQQRIALQQESES